MRHALIERFDAFFEDEPLLRVRLTAFRVLFFGMLAFDQWVLLLPHAPRYGVGGFNVSHLPGLDAVLPLPTPALVGGLHLVGGFLALRVALGLAARQSIVALTVVYSTAYFWSQLDSYQHHYLTCLLLLLFCFVPMEELPALDGRELPSQGPHVRSWAARLMYAQVSIVYLYTAVTKVDASWLDGWALERIIQGERMRDGLAWLAEVLGWQEQSSYALVAHVIMLWQFFVAVAFLVPRLRPLACITGPVFHILVEVIELKIGWFSYYMIAIYYLLLFPDEWFSGIARPVGRFLAPFGVLVDELTAPGVRPSAMLACAAGALAGLLALTVPVEGAGGTALLVGALTTIALWPTSTSPTASALTRAAVHATLAISMGLVVRYTDAGYDYWRFRAGDSARRGELEAAIAFYREANDLRLGEEARHAALGDVYLRLGRPAEAADEYRAALRSVPGDVRARAGLERATRETE